MIFESMKKDYSKIKTIICQLKAGGKQQTATLRFFKKEDGYYTINPFGNNEIKLDENRLFEMEGMPDVLNYRGVLAVSSEPEF